MEIWALYDQGKIGSLRQVQALSYALSDTVKEIPVQLSFFENLRLKRPKISPPYPDVVIASGRAAVTLASTLKNYCFVIVLQHPRMSLKHFDLVIAPSHDQLEGKNVISTIGALHPMNQEILKQQEPLELDLERPWTAVLIGGSSKHYTYFDQDIVQLGESLQKIPGGLLITASRRTSPHHIQLLKNNLSQTKHWFWEGEDQGPNPYMKFLQQADRFIVTSDSINMACEACGTGKPVYIYELPLKKKKFTHFHKSLYENNHAKPYSTPLEEFTPVILNETIWVAELVRNYLHKKL